MSLLRLPEVADRLRLSIRTIRRLIHSGQLPRVKIGRVLLVDESDVLAFVEAAKSGEIPTRVRERQEPTPTSSLAMRREELRVIAAKRWPGLV